MVDHFLPNYGSLFIPPNYFFFLIFIFFFCHENSPMWFVCFSYSFDFFKEQTTSACPNPNRPQSRSQPQGVRICLTLSGECDCPRYFFFHFETIENWLFFYFLCSFQKFRHQYARILIVYSLVYIYPTVHEDSRVIENQRAAFFFLLQIKNKRRT